MARPYLCVLLLLITFLGFNHCEEDFDLDDRPTRPPETEDACMDTIFYCKHFVKQGHCTSPKSDIADYMKRNCPKSCKFCKPGVATQPPLVTRAPRTVPFTTPDCMDTIHFCKWYQDKGYCTDDRFIEYMQRNCPKTCGICKPDAVVAAGAYADACMDTIFYCKHFVKQGHCTSSKSDIADYMKRNCPKSCKFCKPGVATQPPLVTRAPRTG